MLCFLAAQSHTRHADQSTPERENLIDSAWQSLQVAQCAISVFPAVALVGKPVTGHRATLWPGFPRGALPCRPALTARTDPRSP